MKIIHRIGVALVFMMLQWSCESSSNKEHQKSEKSTKPNIIIIIADDLGYGDIGYNGSSIKTPNIDRLAKEGVILNRFLSLTFMRIKLATPIPIEVKINNMK